MLRRKQRRNSALHNCKADLDSTSPLLFKVLAIFCDFIDRFVVDLFGNHNVGILMTWLKCPFYKFQKVDFIGEVIKVFFRLIAFIAVDDQNDIPVLTLNFYEEYNTEAVMTCYAWFILTLKLLLMRKIL